MLLWLPAAIPLLFVHSTATALLLSFDVVNGDRECAYLGNITGNDTSAVNMQRAL